MVRVQDWQENRIKVGTRVVYGSPDPGEFHNQTATVIGISEPDILEAEDEYGRERVVDYYVEITLVFADGTVEKPRASIQPHSYYYGDMDRGDGIEDVFEEGGDIEVLS